MASSQNIKKILSSEKLAASKKLGQNFLINPNTPLAIIEKSGLRAEDIAIELGVGLGSLTLPLSERVRRVIGIEIDGGIVRWHNEQKILPDNVELMHEDLLKVNFQQLSDKIGAKLKIITNLPYSISNPLLFKLYDEQNAVESAVIMLQKEVAERLVAKPGTKAYGVLTVLLGSCATIAKLMNVGPEQFHPRPRVDSQVVKINFSQAPAGITVPEKLNRVRLRTIVNSAFQKRRKTIINALSSCAAFTFDKEGLKTMMEKLHISPQARPDSLTVQQYLDIAAFTGNHNGT